MKVAYVVYTVITLSKTFRNIYTMFLLNIASIVVTIRLGSIVGITKSVPFGVRILNCILGYTNISVNFVELDLSQTDTFFEEKSAFIHLL